MEKRSRIEADEFRLPEVLIQHIQSLMSVKEAAQTSILAKSWYTAWSTRPILDFDQRDFEMVRNRDDDVPRFWEFAKKTIQRYEALNLKIVSFRLWMRNLPHSNCSIAKEFVVKAMKMGAVDFNFEISAGNEKFTLPREVLGSEKLIRLSVSGCKIDLRADRTVSCWNLKSLILYRTCIEGDIIRDLISKCPLIEILTLVTLTYRRPNANFYRAYELGNPYEMYKLKSLFLGYIAIDILFFSNMSSNFPCLKDLTIEHCGRYNYKGIQLSSHSLESISIKQLSLFRTTFDVPNIRKFTFVGSSPPSSVFFTTTSREWESDISIRCSTHWATSFLSLNKLLTHLGSSKVSLSVDIVSVVEKGMDFQALTKSAVENLTIHAPCSVWYTVLECLFRICSPKLVTVYDVPDWMRRRACNIDFMKNLRERNVEGVREICLMMSNELEDVLNVELFEENSAERMSDELEDVLNVELFEENSAERQPLPQKIHFQLRWRA